MLNTLLAILLFSSMLIVFKYMSRFSVNNLQAIVINYFVAGFCGLMAVEQHISLNQTLNADWLMHAATIGVCFITVFNALALGTQKVGLAVSTVANKMSLVVPILAGFIIYGETVEWLKMLAVMLAILGIYFSSTNNGKISFSRNYIPLILFIFLGQGFADVVFYDANLNEYSHSPHFFPVLFVTAGIIGMIAVFYTLFFKSKKFELKSVFWGVLLGIPNYGTLYYMNLALAEAEHRSNVFAMVSMGIIITSAVAGLILFNEKLSKTNWIGLLLAVLAIALLNLQF